MKMYKAAGNLFLSWEANNITNYTNRSTRNVKKIVPATYQIVMLLGRWPGQQKVLAFKYSAQIQSNPDTIG